MRFGCGVVQEMQYAGIAIAPWNLLSYPCVQFAVENPASIPRRKIMFGGMGLSVGSSWGCRLYCTRPSDHPPRILLLGGIIIPLGTVSWGKFLDGVVGYSSR